MTGNAPAANLPGSIAVVRAKLHDIRVTGADLNHHARSRSITLDPEHCEDLGRARLTLLRTERRRRAHLSGRRPDHHRRQDAIPPTALTTIRPRVAVFDEKNRIIDRIEYRVSRNRRGRLHFATRRRQR